MNTRQGIHSLAHVVAVVALLTAAIAGAQNPSPMPERSRSLEATYDYVQSNGPPSACGCFSLNGFGIAYVHPLPGSRFSLLGGVTSTTGSEIGPLRLGLTLVTYTAGARYIPRLKTGYFQPYVEVQAGGVHASGTLANTPSAAGNSIGSAFAATAGGGVNLMLHRRISLKLIDAEYLASNYANGSTNHQNDLRISSGLIFSFCRSKLCQVDGH